MTINKTWSRNMGRLAIDPDQAGLVAGYDMVPDGVTLPDRSGNGNDGVISGAAFEFTEIGPSMKFDGVADYVEIADDPSLDITDDLSLSCWVKTDDTVGSVVNKWLPAGNQRSFGFLLNSGKMQLWISSDGLTSEYVVDTVILSDSINHHIAVVYTKSDNTASFYVDGVFLKAAIFVLATSGIYNGTGNLIIGNHPTGSVGGELRASISDLKVITRALTPAEIQAEYQAGAKAINWKSDYGVDVSIAPESTPGELSNSVARIESGSHIMTTDTIHGRTCKVIECVTAGIVQVPIIYYLHGDETQAAHGTWEWWMKKGVSGATAPNVFFIGSQATDPAAVGFNGYGLRFTGGEAIRLYEYNNGVSAILFGTANADISIDTWYKIKFTRSADGEFTGYKNDVLIDVAGGLGTNPITDSVSPHITSKYLVMDLDAGDKVAWAAPNGECAITKYQGVV